MIDKKDRGRHTESPQLLDHLIPFSKEILIMTDVDTNKPLIVADPTKGVKVNSSVVAKPFRDELKAKVEEMKQMGLGM